MHRRPSLKAESVYSWDKESADLNLMQDPDLVGKTIGLNFINKNTVAKTLPEDKMQEINDHRRAISQMIVKPKDAIAQIQTAQNSKTLQSSENKLQEISKKVTLDKILEFTGNAPKATKIENKIFDGYKVAAAQSKRYTNNMKNVEKAKARLSQFENSLSRQESPTKDRVQRQDSVERDPNKGNKKVKLPKLKNTIGSEDPLAQGHIFFRKNKLVKFKRKVTRDIYDVSQDQRDASEKPSGRTSMEPSPDKKRAQANNVDESNVFDMLLLQKLRQDEEQKH